MPTSKPKKDTHEPCRVKRLPPKEPDTTPPVDMLALLDLHDCDEDAREYALRAYRIKGIDLLLSDLKKTLTKKEDRDALQKYLRMCPSIEKLTAHLLSEYPKSKKWFVSYSAQLRHELAAAAL